MADAGGTEVARISVRVVPKLKGFRKKVKKEAKRAAREASGEEIRFDSVVDEKGAKEKAKKAAKAASGEDVDFDPNLPSRRLVDQARRIAREASGHKVNFGIDIDRSGVSGLLASLSKGFSTVSTVRSPGRIFDNSALARSREQIARITAGLLKVRAIGGRTFQTLNRGVQGFGRQLKKATVPVRTVGKGISSVTKQMRRGFDNLVLSAQYFANDLATDAEKAKKDFFDTSQGQRLVHVMRQVEAGTRRVVRGMQKMNDHAATRRMVFADSLKRVTRYLPDVNKGLNKLRNSQALDRVSDSFRKARDNARKFGDAVRDSAAGRQVDQALLRIQGKTSAIRDRIRKIGESDGFRKLGIQAERAARKIRNIDIAGPSIPRTRGAWSVDDSGMKKTSRTVGKLTDKFKKLSKLVGKSGGEVEHTGRKFLGLTRVGWIVFAVFSLIAPAIGLVGGLMAGLPTLLASVGAAAAVVALGFDGIKDAAQPLVNALQPMKEILSDTFRQELTPQFEKLAAIVPELESGMVGIAKGLSTMSGAMVDIVTMPENVKLLNGFLEKTGNLFSDMAPGIGSMTQGLLTMFDGAAAGFPAMADSFNRFAERFNADMAMLVDSGQLQAAMDSMATIFESFFTNIHSMLVTGIQELPNMTEGLTGFFDGFTNLVNGAMPLLATFSNSLGIILGELGTQLGGIFEAATPGLQTFFENMTPVVTSLLQELGPAFATVAEHLGNFMGTLSESLGPALETLAPVVGQIAEQLGTVLGEALQALEPHLPGLVESFATMAETMSGALLEGLIAITPEIPALVDGLASLAEALAGGLLDGMLELATYIPEATTLLVLLVDAVTLLVDAFGMLKPATDDASSSFSPVGAAIDMILPNVRNLGDLIRSTTDVIDSLGNAFGELQTWFSTTLTSLQTMISGWGASISSWWSETQATISTGVSNAIATIQTLPGRAQAALGNLGGLLVSSGKALVQGFINGIKSMIGAVAEAASSVVAAARDFFPFSPAKKGPFSGKGYTTYSGKALTTDFAAGILSGKTSVADAASAIAKAASDGIEQANAAFEAHHTAKILDPVLEKNAEKIAKFREQQAKKDNLTAEKAREDYQKMLDSLEVPDFRDINRSVQSFYIDGSKEMLQKGLMRSVKDADLAGQLRTAALDAVEQAREVMGSHPFMSQIEANVNADHFEWAIQKAIEDSEIAYIPVELGIANLDQFKSDLGFGNGALSRAIDAAMEWNPNETDARAFEKESKSEVHYHVTDMQEAIRLENERQRRNSMRYI